MIWAFNTIEEISYFTWITYLLGMQIANGQFRDAF